MSIPFFLIVAALAAAWFGHRHASLAFWAAGLLALLLLFRLGRNIARMNRLLLQLLSEVQQQL